MAELLLELFSEELPARMQARAAEDLAQLVLESLKEAGIKWAPDSVRICYTPRRLILSVDGLPLAQPDVTEEKRGPRIGAPDQAIQGFVRANNMISIGEAEIRNIDKGQFYFAVKHHKGKSTAEVLAAIVCEAILQLPWPKTMRWSTLDLNGDPVTPAVAWIRPLKSILAVFDGKPLPGGFALGRLDLPGKTPRWAHPDSAPATDQSILVFERRTVGHRFLDPREINVAGLADYKVKLREAYVIVEPAERRAEIERQARMLASSEALLVRNDVELLDEVTGLVEWPVVLMGRIDDQFMDIPPEVLTTSMRVNQKYFSLLDKTGKLAPRFLVVANMTTKDDGKAIVAGNERVLRARLSDAKFFWDQDRKTSLQNRVPLLGDITFHAKLGTMRDKELRIRELAAQVANFVPNADINQARRAAMLAKADLTSGMVGEFPELQGVMGRYYAQHDREELAVADAIAEHYRPLGPNDPCPTAPVSVAVALADKIDTLVGFFAINEKPTGSKDPFALRRAALGVIRLLLENKIRIGLRQICLRLVSDFVDNLITQKGLPLLDTQLMLIRLYGSQLGVERKEPKTEIRDGKHIVKMGEVIEEAWTKLTQRGVINVHKEAVLVELLDFFADRLKVALREKGVRHDLISAVFALGGEDDLVRLLARVDALQSFLDSPDGANLLVAYRRASNIVRIEEKKDGKTYNSGVDGVLLRQDEEKALHRALAASSEAGVRALEGEDFTGAMGALAQLRAPVDAFFDKVTVNCDEPDLRANRLRLLSEIRATLNRVADFSQIEG